MKNLPLYNNQAGGQKDEGVRNGSKATEQALFQAPGKQQWPKQSPCSHEQKYIEYQMIINAMEKHKHKKEYRGGVPECNCYFIHHAI